MDRQAVYEKAGLHLLKQGRKSKTGSLCRYRNAEGLACAIGALIPNERYNDSMEDIGVTYLLSHADTFGRDDGVACLRSALEDGFGELTDGDVHFLFLLQTIHDRCGPADWKAKLVDLSYKHDLDNTKILNFTRENG